MADIFGKPTKEQIEKARELYGDPIFYWATNTAIEALDRIKEEGDYQMNYGGQFYRLARLVIRNCGVSVAFMIVEIASEDLAEDLWKGKPFDWIPDFKEEKTKGYEPDLKNIKGKLTISKVLKDYGVEFKGKKAKCPFHDDKDPSLSFDDEKGLWKCFGCGVSGDIFHLIGMLEELKNGN